LGRTEFLPAGEYLQALAERFGHAGYWYAPTLLWISSNSRMLTGICWVGMIASLLLVLNFWPRGMLAVCFLCFLSFVSASQDFSAYQSDGMLLEAGFTAMYFAPAGFRPGWGEASPPSRASLFLLIWEGFRIYFESGVAKIMGGDPQWRNFTALDEYYQNGPLADVDRLVYAASAALVPCSDRFCDAGPGTGAGVDDVSAASLSHLVFFCRDDLADRDHSLRELHLSELSRSRFGVSVAR